MLQTVTVRMLALLLALCRALEPVGSATRAGPGAYRTRLDVLGTTEDRVEDGRGQAQAIIGVVAPE
jgi:hypothetical protein